MNVKIAGAALTILLMGCSSSMEDASKTVTATDEVLMPESVKALKGSFIPTDFNAPVLVETQTFKLIPLSPKLAKIDFDAYMSSIKHLQQTFTRSNSWPHKGISDADALLDMETEQSRFENRESFAYAVLTPDGQRERGCVYIYPSNIPGYGAVVRMWVTKAEYDAGFDAELNTWVTQWIQTEWPFSAVAYPGRSIDWNTWDALVAENKTDAESDGALLEQNRQTAESFIDAFYSFDSVALNGFLNDADESATKILYYQGWAEGGNYIVLDRKACEPESAQLIRCSIKVQDDPVVELKTGFNVTDTFHLTFDGSAIASIETSSNDQPIYYEARKWVEENMPDVMTGPCLDRSNGGTTPGDCARAMTQGYKQFYAATRASDTSDSE
jgi:hypothetical protein